MATDLNNDIKAFARVASGTNSFFPEARANMNPADFRRLRANYVDNVAPLEDRLANMRNNVARLQSQELAFRQSMLAFDQQKEDLARRKEAQDPEKIEAIGNIVTGELPAADKKDAIFKMGIDNPDMLAYNPLFKNAYNEALKSVDAKIDDDNQRNAKTRATEAQLRNQLFNYGQAGFDTIQQLDMGEIDTQTAFSRLDGLQKQKSQAKAAGEKFELDQARLERFRKLRTIKNIDLEDSEAFKQADEEGKKNLKEQFARTGGKTFAPEYRNQLIDRLVLLTGRDESEFANEDDQSLYKRFDQELLRQEAMIERGTLDPDDLVTNPQEFQIKGLVNPE
tara:strand:+ start:3298 stop:4308 length:1011 start_codon:yes stop_codon:yes gene_type:complete